MVISYTIQELNAIGEIVFLKECISRMSLQQQQQHQYHQQHYYHHHHQEQYQRQNSESGSPLPSYYQTEHKSFTRDNSLSANDLIQSIIRDIGIIERPQLPPVRQEPPLLTNSVAEFFRKAQQIYRPEPNVDPTRARRLSDVEAELITSRRDSS